MGSPTPLSVPYLALLQAQAVAFDNRRGIPPRCVGGHAGEAKPVGCEVVELGRPVVSGGLQGREAGFREFQDVRTLQQAHGAA